MNPRNCVLGTLKIEPFMMTRFLFVISRNVDIFIFPSLHYVVFLTLNRTMNYVDVGLNHSDSEPGSSR